MALQLFSGLSSGVDTASIVQQLVALERQKLVRPKRKEKQIGAEDTALKDIQTKLKALKTAAQALRSVGTWGATQTVESSDQTKVAAVRTANAAPGAYTVNVTQLARAAQQTFAYTPPAAADTLTVGAKTFNLTAGQTLDDVVSMVNAASDSPVYATKVGTELVLSARTTGAASTFSVTAASLTENVAKRRDGLDAAYEIDGVAQPPVATNGSDTALAGVKLTFKALGSTTITVGTVGVDQTAVKDKVKAFVEAYNTLVTTTRAKMDEKPVNAPTTDSEATKGQLFSDRGLSSMLSRFRVAMTDSVAGNAATLDELRELGITTGAPTAGINADAVAGKLVLDESKLTAALATDPEAVKKLLGGVTGVDGFAQRIEKLVEAEAEGEGVIPGRLKANEQDLKRVRDGIADMERRITAKEKYLKVQFAAMERALANSNAQGGWLSAQLASLPTQSG